MVCDSKHGSVHRAMWDGQYESYWGELCMICAVHDFIIVAIPPPLGAAGELGC